MISFRYDPRCDGGVAYFCGFCWNARWHCAEQK